MLIDDSVVLKYLNSDNFDDISSHWIFKNIEEGQFLFELPDKAKRDDINKILNSMKKTLLQFTPINEEIYTALYPEWKSLVKDVNVILLVGCPNPYDAMVREYKGKEYLIFDLIRFFDYSLHGYDIDMIIKKLITHETSHLCLHNEYPVPADDKYVEQLKYITFDEGFAHLLSFKDNIDEVDFSKIIKEHYNTSLKNLKEAMKEVDLQKQKFLLEKSNSGSYWSKFAAVSGKLFLASHLDEVVKIYNSGIDNFISSMGL